MSLALKISRIALFLIAACAPLAYSNAQSQPQSESGACLAARSMKADQLHGRWAVRFTKPPAGLPERAVMQLRRHAEFSESLAGTVSRKLGGSGLAHAAQAALAGDLEDGMLLLDESSDNVSITGTWNGEMRPGSCGKVFRGVWKDTSSSAAPNAADVAFTLTRLP